MAANDEFPRGWSYGFAGSGTAPIFDLPAVSGISHVITGGTLYSYTGSTANSALVVSLDIFMNGVLDTVIGVIVNSAAAQVVSGPLVWSGKVIAPVGQSVRITTNSWPGALTSFIMQVEGYDI